MARYLSKYSSFKKTVKKGEQTLIQGAHGPVLHELSAPHIALFQKMGVTPWERDYAIAHFGFKGIAEGEDPLNRMSSYDTDEEAVRLGWGDEQKAAVEKLLDLGQHTGDYVRIERPRLPAPWPNYDELLPQGRRSAEMVASQIAETVKALGLNVDTVLAYERENRNRADVLEALQPEPELLISA